MQAYSGAFDQEVLERARSYAVEHRLSLQAVMNAAVAEYCAKREDAATGPAPQLHYRRGSPPRAVLQRAQALLLRDPRGRKMSRSRL